MADRKFEYEISASDESFRRAMDRVATEAKQAGAAVGDAFKRAEREAESAESVFGRVQSTLAGAFSVGAIVQFGRAIAASTIEAERSTALLNSTLRATGFAAGLSGQQVEGLVQELAGISTYDDDPIRQGVSTLLRFKEVSGDTFREASKLALDLASATGKDLPSAFLAVGKALQDPVGGMKALREAGVKLSEGQQNIAEKMRQAGDAAGAQRLVLAELAKSVGGAAEGENAGLYGSTRALANSWDDLLKAIGQTDFVSRMIPQTFRQIASEINAVSTAAGGADTGRQLQSIRKEIDELTAARERYRRSNADTSGIDSALVRLTSDRTFLQRKQAAEILSRSSPSDRDARDLRLATDYDKIKAAGAQGLSGGRSGAAPRDGTQRIAEMGVQMYLDQWADLERQTKAIRDEIKRTREETEQDIIRGLQLGPEMQAKATKDFEDLAKKLVADTQIGKEDSILGIGGEVDSLNEALIRGTISAAEYEQAFAMVQDRLNDVRGIQKDFAKEIEKDQTDALRAIEFAVQGWGRSFTDTIVEMVKTGKMQISDLVSSILTDMARLAVQQTITKPLFDGLSSALTGAGKNLFGSGSSSNPTPAPNVRFDSGNGFTQGTPKAGGGAVFPGMIYPINERGIEYFAPSVPGTVIPTNGLGGGGTVNLNITANVAAGADAATVRAAILDAATIAESNIARRMRVGA